MSQQTSYTIDHPKGINGQIADCAPRTVDTKLNEESVAGAMQFGVGVARGTADNQVLLPTVADTVFGFTVYTKGFELVAGSNIVEIAENDDISVMVQGALYVCPEDDVTAGGDVYVRHVAAGAEQLGAVRSDADGTDASVAVGWVFEEDGLAGSIVKIRKA